ncbi:basic blue protein-like [Nymphaea colorata]|nr:basic blue protein-like [Nymphaea colorata]
MAMGRGSAFLALVALCVVAHFSSGHAATYVVGDSRGWTFNVDKWPVGKTFRAGDVLIFKYNPMLHNTVVVSTLAYQSCAATRDARTLTSGNDRITLSRGVNSFICTFAGHCQAGMKIQVVAN